MRKLGKLKKRVSLSEIAKVEIREKYKIERESFVGAKTFAFVVTATAELSHGGMLRHTVPSLPERARLQ